MSCKLGGIFYGDKNMSDVFRVNRKASDAEIIRLNSVGLSLATIASILDCHPTTVTLRLKSLNIPPADTRRTFMEDIFRTLSGDQQEWFADQVSNVLVKEYVKQLIVNEFNLNQGKQRV